MTQQEHDQMVEFARKRGFDITWHDWKEQWYLCGWYWKDEKGEEQYQPNPRWDRLGKHIATAKKNLLKRMEQ